MAYTFNPSGAGTIDVKYGVDALLTDYVIQDLTVTEDVNTVQIPDQKGAVAQIKSMQHHWTISFTAIGKGDAPFSGNLGAQQFSLDGTHTYYYHVNSCERRATYNDTQKWAVTMEAWDGAYAYTGVDSTSGQAIGPTA